MKKIAILILLLCTATIFYLIGIYTGKSNLFTLEILKKYQNGIIRDNKPLIETPEKKYSELMDLAFTDSLIQENEQILPAVRSIDDLEKVLRSSLNNIDEFYSFFHNIRIVEYKMRSKNILEIVYEISCQKRSAFAYMKGESNYNLGFLVIPGSGQNQGYEMTMDYPGNYQKNILNILKSYCDTYLLIKLNQGNYAIHNGKRKLNKNFIVNYYLNRGGSYSARYIEDALVLVKYIQEKYKYSGISGLSQGGEAALISSLFSKPNYAIISSGYTVLTDKIEYASHNQIIIPGIQNFINSNGVRDSIARSNTKWLFTWGSKESAVYGIEARDSLTLKKFRLLPNVTCVIHNHGHIYPDSAIKDFMQINQNRDKDEAKNLKR